MKQHAYPREKIRRLIIGFRIQLRRWLLADAAQLAIPTAKSSHRNLLCQHLALGVFTANKDRLRKLHRYGEVSVFATLYLNFFSDVYF
jgi:hypothetical protein